MMYVNFRLQQVTKAFFHFVLIIALLFFSTVRTLAAPTGDIHDEPSGPAAGMYYVDLIATVPDGFEGMVYVLLSHEDGTHYTVRCDKLSDYESTAELPLGRYVVESVYTSEDSMVYEAFLETEGFVLEERIQTLAVDVKYNAEGAAFDPSQDVPPEDTSSDDPSSADPDVDTPANPNPSAPTTDEPSGSADPEVNPPADEGRGEDPQEEPTLLMSIGSVVKSFLTFLVGSAVFAGIIFILVYFVRRRLHS